MENMSFSFFMIIIAYLCIAYIAALQYEKIAELKGHKGYFWYCFLLGIIGWLMVVALPDLNSHKTSSNDDNHDELPDL